VEAVKIPELKKFIGKRIEAILLDDSKKEKPEHKEFRKLKDLSLIHI